MKGRERKLNILCKHTKPQVPEGCNAQASNTGHHGARVGARGGRQVSVGRGFKSLTPTPREGRLTGRRKDAPISLLAR